MACVIAATLPCVQPEPVVGSPPGGKQYRPAWLVMAPFLGTPPALTRRQWQVLGLVSLASLFEAYASAILSFALPQIQRGLSIAEGDVGYLGSVIRFGALPAFLITLAADRVGRRRALLLTIAAYTLLTGATALAPDLRTFAALQFAARVFLTAELLLAIVVVSEELDPGVRGWGIGALFAIQSCGVGVAAILLPVVEALGLGWRTLYVIGLVPLSLIPWLRRTLPETERFREGRERVGVQHALRPMLQLVRAYPGRFAATAGVVFALSLGGAGADLLGPKYLQDRHGWSPGGVALLYVLGGVVGIGGAAYLGRLSDRIGRRPVAVGAGVALVGLVTVFFNVGGWLLGPVWVAMIFALIGNDVILSTYGAELFPTSYRSTASGARMIVATLGAGLGLVLESLLYSYTGSHWTAVTVLMAVALLAPLLVALTFPETAGRDLDEISPERPDATSG